MANEEPKVVVMKSPKSLGMAILLTILFGPLGLLYSTVGGAIFLIVATPVAIFLTHKLWIFFLVWPLSIIASALATYDYNKKLLAGKK